MDATIVPLRSDEDVVRLRQAVRECLVSVGFSLVDQTKMITAASELARNTVRYGGGGESHLLKVMNGSRKGVTLVFIDHGPGIPDIKQALTDGYTSGGGMGLGLGGAKRLSDEFDIDSEPGRGTTVKITKWKPF
ncbi:serine/threonine-protein kinase RsbT [Noviherbaspirillum humi]|uniref:Serine/threonine-protein kinase RsbT n=1 Tax=Noviherbaspirillum humi TaxID=1688639 RepID=A0A239I4N9_9BURK|nr:serine/threonine-protein kinase RsbT [Noviherbaspirillum humi]